MDDTEQGRTVINPPGSKLQRTQNKAVCPDCECILSVPWDVEKAEILSCPGCGLEFEVEKIGDGGGCLSLHELVIEGEDWGE